MGRVLKSWKAIADYLDVAVRTAERWESMYGLPVHRPQKASKGAVFALSSELDDWIADAPRRANAAVPGANIVMNRSNTTTVLAVDDNDAHLYAIHRVLTAAGFFVVAARSGSDAIERAFRHLPSAVLLDVCLPDVDGFEVCRQLKSHAKTAVVPILLHTAEDDCEESRLKAKGAGAVAFLTYPMQQQALISMLKTCLEPAAWPKESDRFNFDSTSLA